MFRRGLRLSGCTGSDLRWFVPLPLADDKKLAVDLETFWRQEESLQLLAEIAEGKWRGVRDSNPWPPA
jgi:hypothetical protein